MFNYPQFCDILLAAETIRGHVHQTPVLTSQGLNALFNKKLYFKCENFQKVGAFKFRGATNAVLSLPAEAATKGVATHSSGNHAAALALAAQQRGIAAHIVMPGNSPKVKKDAVKSYGAAITFCEPTLEARESTLNEVIKQTGATFIHPYNNFHVVAGQGTAALELLHKTGKIDAVIAPVGGGGLISGTGIAVKNISPGTTVIATEPANADDAFRSYKAQRLIPVKQPDTIADGLRTSLCPMTFDLIAKNIDEIVTVSEDAIAEAMLLVWQRLKIIIEPSSAVPVAALLENKIPADLQSIGVIFSGGNVDFNQLPFDR